MDAKNYILKIYTIWMLFGILFNFIYLNCTWFYMLDSLCGFMNYIWLCIWSAYMWQDSSMEMYSWDVCIFYNLLRSYEAFYVMHLIMDMTCIVECFKLWHSKWACQVKTRSFNQVGLLLSITFYFMIEYEIGGILLGTTNCGPSS